MTDDDAFIRAIVDNPGDDLPRLAYADWLDDRADPRGAYLRVEAEWAKPWKTGTPPGWSVRQPGMRVPEWAVEPWPGLEEMLTRTAAYDPVWVARVSRPPVGVCCDHIQFSDSLPHLTPDDLVVAEETLGTAFPPPLIAFLLNYNGGTPSRMQLVHRSGSEADGWESDWVSLEFFAGWPTNPKAKSESSTTILELREEITSFEGDLEAFGGEDILTQYVPFAGCPSYPPWILLVAVSSPHAGGVFSVILDEEQPTSALLVPSIPQLLARIITGYI